MNRSWITRNSSAVKTLAVLAVFTPMGLTSQFANASIFILQDPYGVSATSCATASCDVIGEKNWFDIDKVRVDISNSAVQIDIFANFINPDFSAYNYPGGDLRLNVGDLLFSVNGQYKYGIALQNHAGSVNGGPAGGNITAGVLYEISNGNAGVMIASQVLQHTSQYIYRYDSPVWLWNQGSNLTNEANGTVTITNIGTVGSGSNLGYYNQATISFTPTPEFLDYYSGPGFGVEFYDATCANDLLQGFITGSNNVPEPASMALLCIGLAGLRARRRGRR